MKVFVDEESARTSDRTHLQEMLTFCGKNRGANSHVVVADLSRLARNVSDQGSIVDRLADMGIFLVSVDEPHIDKSAAGKLSANPPGSVNQFYSDVLSERVLYRISEAGQGRRPVSFGARLLAVRTRRKAGLRILGLMNRRALIREAFELAATGS